MPNRFTYPATVAECIDENLRYKRGTLRAVRAFARSRPWRGTFDERCEKFRTLHRELCRLYGIDVGLSVAIHHEQGAGAASGGSYYMPLRREIVLRGRLSVVTYLHEFAHALDKDERGACRWSLNLFKRYFPRSFARCRHEGHVLIRAN